MWKRRQKDAHEHLIASAWHTANLSRAEKLPTFSDYLRAGRPQTEQEREAAWLQIAAVHGLKVRRHDKHNPKRRIYRES